MCCQKSAPRAHRERGFDYASDLDLDDLQFERRPLKVSKRTPNQACDRLFTWRWRGAVEGSGVTANAMTPGLITETGLYRNATAD